MVDILIACGQGGTKVEGRTERYVVVEQHDESHCHRVVGTSLRLFALQLRVGFRFSVPTVVLQFVVVYLVVLILPLLFRRSGSAPAKGSAFWARETRCRGLPIVPRQACAFLT